MNSRMYKLTIRTFTDELKTEIVRRMQSGEPAETLAHHLCVIPKLLEGWRKEYESEGPKTGRQTEEGHEAAATGSLRLEALRRVVGRQALEIDFLKRTISRLKARMSRIPLKRAALQNL